MATKRLYRQDAYLTQNTTTINSIEKTDGFDVIICNESVFFPEGGGQPCDVGTVSFGADIYNITDVYDKDLQGDVYHLTDAPEGTFSVGDEVCLSINWDNRFSNMQRHSGEHMFSGTFHTLFGGVNKGFHIGEDYVTMDIDLDGAILTDEEIDLAERTVNDAIWANLPIRISVFDSYEESLVMPVRKKVPHEGSVSIATVGDLPNPYDCIACCGTLPSYSAEIGILVVYKNESYKGMNRIYFDCGFKAKEKLTQDMKLLNSIANKYSCSTEDIIYKLDLIDEEISSLKVANAKLAAYIKDNEKNRILSEINTGDENIFIYSLSLLKTDDLLKLGFSVINETKNKLLLLIHPETLTCLIFSSGDIKCGRFIKENAPLYNGRGGGKDDHARAVFQNMTDMKAFADAISSM
ncbi:MAG TPA: alanyl-tRNA editing protein [Mogibacterium sp.]|nr:alanyl-tRNA editing protein [Mogibacterium sp.]